MCYATQEESAFVCMLSPYAIRCDIRYVPFYVIRQLQAKFKWKWNSTTKILSFCMQSHLLSSPFSANLSHSDIYISYNHFVKINILWISLFINSIQTKNREIYLFRKVFNLHCLIVSVDSYRDVCWILIEWDWRSFNAKYAVRISWVTVVSCVSWKRNIEQKYKFKLG